MLIIKKPFLFLEKKFRKSNKGFEATDAIEKIAEALSQPRTPLQLPPPHEDDEVDGFLTMLGFQLRKLNRNRQAQAMLQMHKIIFDISLSED